MYTNHMTTHEMVEFFDLRFGLNPYEMVVLMGVHSAAVAVRENVGFGNPGREDGWIHDAEEYKLSNLYYTSMLESVWEIQMVENDDRTVPDRYQWYFDPEDEGPIMTTSDMSLIIDPEGFITTDSSGREGLVKQCWDITGFVRIVRHFSRIVLVVLSSTSCTVRLVVYVVE